MSNSSDVVAGNDAKASEYNNLRKDVLNITSGHTHDGADSRGLSADVILDIAKSRYLSIPPFDCQPDPDDSANITITFSEIQMTSASAVAFWYKLHLPHGCVLQDCYVYGYRDSSHGAVFSISAWKIALADGTDTQLGSTGSTGSGTGNTSASVTGLNHTVDNTSYSYGIIITMDNDDDAGSVKVFGLKIHFQSVTPLP